MRQKVLLLMLATVFAFASSFAQTKKDVRLPKKVQETLTEMQKSSRKNQSAKTLQRQTDLSRQEGEDAAELYALVRYPADGAGRCVLLLLHVQREYAAEHRTEDETAGSRIYHRRHHRTDRAGGTVPQKRRPSDPVRGRRVPGLYDLLVPEGRKDAGKDRARAVLQ